MGVKWPGVNRVGVKCAGVKRAGVKRAGVKHAGVKCQSPCLDRSVVGIVSDKYKTLEYSYLDFLKK